MTNRVILLILDGWGIGDKSKGDVIYHASTPFMDSLVKKYPHSYLLTDGENVGLPEGQMGNSEVGHFTIGAGRVVYQDLVRINKAVRENSIFENEVLKEAFRYAAEKGKSVHLIGLVSPGGVHSMDTHLYKLCEMTDSFGLTKVFIHALTDGRDTDPHSGLGYVENLLKHLSSKGSSARIASLVGRYYTMDRDKRWERIKMGYDLMVHGTGIKTGDILQAIKESYEEGITDEFIKPIVCVNGNSEPLGLIREGDVVFCFNFRTDRLREITVALTQKEFPEYGMKPIPLHYLTMTQYDDSYKNIHVVYGKQNVNRTLGEIIASEGLKQLRIAETEKYPHVTFFFSGGREEEFRNEKRILIPSPKVATYDLQPEMSAYEVKDAMVAELNRGELHFVCLNFANGDMVGHTGVYDAIKSAVEAVDRCVQEVVEAAQRNGYTPLIIADHGNADNALNPDGTPNTAHSLNPVPCILVSEEYKTLHPGTLSDVAPTILHLMGLTIPEEMKGKILVDK